jgi:hypothetical protein
MCTLQLPHTARMSITSTNPSPFYLSISTNSHTIPIPQIQLQVFHQHSSRRSYKSLPTRAHPAQPAKHTPPVIALTLTPHKHYHTITYVFPRPRNINIVPSPYPPLPFPDISLLVTPLHGQIPATLAALGGSRTGDARWAEDAAGVGGKGKGVAVEHWEEVAW